MHLNRLAFKIRSIVKCCGIFRYLKDVQYFVFAPVKAAKPAAYFIVSFECGKKSTGTRSEPKANKQPLSFATNDSSAAVEILEDESSKFGVLILKCFVPSCVSAAC
jgi:hypothetical protein